MLSQVTQDCCRLDGKAFLTQEVDGGTVPGGGEAWPGSGLWMPGGGGYGESQAQGGVCAVGERGVYRCKGPLAPFAPRSYFHFCGIFLSLACELAISTQQSLEWLLRWGLIPGPPRGQGHPSCYDPHAVGGVGTPLPHFLKTGPGKDPPSRFATPGCFSSDAGAEPETVAVQRCEDLPRPCPAWVPIANGPAWFCRAEEKEPESVLERV